MGDELSTHTYPTMQVDFTELDNIIEKDFGKNKENLIMILQAIQKHYGYLPEPALNYLAAEIDIPISQIYGVATFYATFKLKPRGRNVISVCRGTACYVRGSKKVFDEVEKELNVTDGETTADNRFTLETVRCIGGCSLGPMVKVNDDIYGRLSSERIKKLLDQYE
jgi:NADH-quinone oxidoreductase E subunit